MSFCKCQDSSGKVCGKKMTKREKKQDGMCSNCANHVWVEMTSKTNHIWYHIKCNPLIQGEGK